MNDPLEKFVEEFDYIPEIIFDNHKDHKDFIVFGMGGSAISVGLLSKIFPGVTVRLHNDYGLPKDINKTKTLLIFNSYSGNTEEVLDSFNIAINVGYRVACISTGGELVNQASLHSVPHIVLPKTGIEPRFSIGYQMIALLQLMRLFAHKDDIKEYAQNININSARELGRSLAEFINNRSVVIYSSSQNAAIGHTIKAAINEGAKHPAFSSIFSEANHNELEAYSDISDAQKKEYIFVLLKDADDHPRIQKRMQIFNDLFVEKGLSPFFISLIFLFKISIPSG